MKQSWVSERFEPRSHFKTRLSLIVRVNVVLNRTVVVDSDLARVGSDTRLVTGKIVACERARAQFPHLPIDFDVLSVNLLS